MPTEAGTPIVFGAAYSVYVRSARLALDEKGVDYRLREIDVFAPGGPPKDYLWRHPFGRIPAFEHEGFQLYETCAITRYVDDGFVGPPLQPDDARRRARMTQIISILDNYGYRPMLWDIYVERVEAAREGRAPDEARIAAAVPRARRCLTALADLAEDGAFLAGAALSLADLHAAPMLAYFQATPEGQTLMAEQLGLMGWWQRMAARGSMARTRPSPRAVA